MNIDTLFTPDILDKVKADLKLIASNYASVMQSNSNEYQFQGYYLTALLFKHLHKLELDIPYTINVDLQNKRNKNYVFLNINHSHRPLIYFMPIEASYNINTDILDIKFPQSSALYTLFTKKLVSLESVLDRIATPNYIVSVCDFLLEIETISSLLGIKIHSSILDHLFFFNRKPFVESFFNYTKDDVKYTAKYLSNQLKHPFFSSNSQLWHNYKYKVKNFNAIYYPLDNQEVWAVLTKHISCWRYYSSNTKSKMPLHPLYLNKVKINRIVKFSSNYPESFVETFWNEIIKQELVLKFNMKNYLNHRLTNLYTYLKNNFSLQEIVCFLERSKTQDPFFWGIVETCDFSKLNVKTIDELEEFLIKEKNNVYNVEIKKLDISHRNFRELNSTNDLIQEGANMKHCVGGRWKLLESGTKFFHITTGLILTEHSTLEIRYDFGSWRKIEHKSKSNAHPIDEHINLANKLIEKLNSQRRN